MTWLRRLVLALFILYSGLICVLTHTPADFAARPSMGDKLAHFLAYGAFAGLLYLWLWIWRPGSALTPVVVLAIAMIYGMSDELTQPYFHRTADFSDWTADAAGAAVAVVVMGLVQWVSCARSSSIDGQRRA